MDRFGAEFEGAEVTLDRLAELFESVQGLSPDEEYRSVSLSDSDEWNLEFYPSKVTFENVDEDSEGEVWHQDIPAASDRLELARLFLAGDLDRIRDFGSDSA